MIVAFTCTAFAGEINLQDKGISIDLDDVAISESKAEILEFEQEVAGEQKDDINYFVEVDGEWQNATREEALKSSLPSVAVIGWAKTYRFSGDYAYVGIGAEASHKIKRYSGTCVMYDCSLINQYERSRYNFYQTYAAGTQYLSDQYCLYVGSAKEARAKIINQRATDIWGRSTSLTNLWSAYARR